MTLESPVEDVERVDPLDSREAGGKVIRGGSLRALAYAGGVLVGVVSTPLVVRHLGVVEYGQFVTVNSLIFIVAGLVEGGLSNVGVRRYSTSDAAGRARLMRSLLGLRLVINALGVVGAVAFALAAGYEPVMVQGAAIAGLGLMIASVQMTLTVPLASNLRLGWLTAADVLRQVSTTVLLVALVAVGAPLLPFWGVSAVTAVLALALTVALVRRESPLRPGFDLAEWRSLLSETVVYAAATALGVVYFQVAIIATSILSTERETGLYSVAFRIVEIVNGIPWLLVVSAFPVLSRAARDDAERLRYALQRMLEVALIVGAWFSMCAIVGASFAVAFIGGADFEESVGPLRVLGIGMIATFLVATWAFAMLSLKLHRDLMIANGIALVLAVVLAITLISAHGALGAAWTTAVLEIALSALYLVLLVRRRPDLRPRAAILPKLAVALGAALATGLLLPAHDVIAVVAASAVYFILLVALRAIPPEISLALRRKV